jgi:hypothetical protein
MATGPAAFGMIVIAVAIGALVARGLAPPSTPAVGLAQGHAHIAVDVFAQQFRQATSRRTVGTIILIFILGDGALLGNLGCAR